MTAQHSANQFSNCCAAAACTSAQILNNVDTALGVVSIFVIDLIIK